MNCQCNGSRSVKWAKRELRNRPAWYCDKCGAFGEWLAAAEARNFYRTYFSKEKKSRKSHSVHPPRQLTLF